MVINMRHVGYVTICNFGCIETMTITSFLFGMKHPVYLGAYPSSLGVKVLESLGPREVGNTEATIVERGCQRLRRVRVLYISPVNGGVDGRDNTPEFRGGREVRVAADGRDVLGKGVEVLLGGDEGRGTSNDLGVVTKRGNDLISKLKLCASAGTGKKDTRRLTGEGTGRSRGAKVAEALDDILNRTLLAETGLANSRKGGEHDKLGLHHDDCQKTKAVQAVVVN
jgi:hypothetical protein